MLAQLLRNATSQLWPSPFIPDVVVPCIATVHQDREATESDVTVELKKARKRIIELGDQAEQLKMTVNNYIDFNDRAMKCRFDADDRLSTMMERRIEGIEIKVAQIRQTSTSTVASIDVNNKLENLVKNLSIRVDELEIIPGKICDSCSEKFRSTKKTHTKCKKCYEMKKVKSCKNCKAEFKPSRAKFVLCPRCHKQEEFNLIKNGY